METRRLNDNEFKATFSRKMLDVTKNAPEVVDIWPYVNSVSLADLKGHTVFNNLVERVYRNDDNRFEHVLVMTKTRNVYLVIVIDLAQNSIYGHRLLDLNKEYGILETG